MRWSVTDEGGSDARKSIISVDREEVLVLGYLAVGL